MKVPFHLSGLAAACALALSLPALAQEPPMPRMHPMMRPMPGKQMSAEDRQAMARKRLDREAAMLEIKASQQPAWEAYGAAKLDLMAAFGGMMRPKADAGADAATLTRQHAERAAAVAQKLAALADATEKLQAVLAEDQRQVLNRISRQRQGFGRGGRDGTMCEQMQGRQGPPAKDAGKSAAKARQPQQ